MFVRKKKNKSGVISIQIIDKSSGKYKVVKTLGNSSDNAAVENLFTQAQQQIPLFTGQSQLNFNKETEDAFVASILNSIEDIRLVSPELLLGKLFSRPKLSLVFYNNKSIAVLM